MLHRFSGLSQAHFVGIGGAGMSGIAEVLSDYELEVTGSDLTLSETTERLEKLGVEIRRGHAAENIAGAQLVVISSAVPPDNVEVVAARERGIPVVRRAEMLSELMRLKYGIAVAGTHGKTTTTSLIGTVLTEVGLDPTVIVGGRLRVTGTGARRGQSDYLVAEADEFDRSFLRLAPVLAVVTSIDEDHLDTYGDMEAVEDAFVTFADRVPFFGRVILCLDDRRIQALLPRLAERRLMTYGLSPQADLVARDLDLQAWKSSFTVELAEGGERRTLGRVELPMPGVHNVRNALAALGVGLSLEVEFDDLARAMARFGGVHRRFEQVGAWRGAVVVDDYAHHPTEVEAALKAARQACPKGQIHAVFQPHLYSRTRQLADEFGRALLSADHALVTDVYGSREEPEVGVDGTLVVEAAKASGHRRVESCPDWRDAPAKLEGTVAGGDLVLTLGAGDVYRLAETLAGEEA